jgi:hypothetical protein
MSFWREANAQAGREYGARHWRWFAAASLLRSIWPALAVLGGLGVALLAWRGGSAAVDALNARETGRPILLALLAGAALAVLALGVRAGVRYFTGPPRRRRRFR